nr:MAG TPA: minor capsid protein [Caudoviricetes sp.]
MRFLKALTRYKILKSSDDMEILLQNYTAAQIEKLETITAEILAISTENTGKETLKKLLLNKAKSANIDVLPSDLENLYIILSKRALKKVAESMNKTLAFVFDEIDADAVEAMRKSFYWMGKEYNENLQSRLKDKIESVFKGEIELDEIGAELKREFGSIINADESYFKGVSDHIALQARNVATVTQGAKYGVKYYKILAIMDARTTQICRSMHGRIIPAAHLEAQADKILNANSLASKKAAAAWRSEAYLGKSDKMDSNFGLPPYHFCCRTEAIPVWVDEEECGGVKMRNTQPLYENEIIKHIDKMGVERYANKKTYNHSVSSSKRNVSPADTIKALNSILKIAPHRGHTNRSVAMSQNGYFMVFDGDYLYNIFKPSDNLERYFKRSAVLDKTEIIKWKFAIFA